jgi:prolyl-tRNA synthetase
MRQSQYFLKTSKTVSEDDKIASSKLLRQAGYIKESVAGRYFMLPIGQRVQRRIMQIIKEEMDGVQAQEMMAPTLHPLELWKETNRTNTAGFELMKVKDRRDAEFALGGTAEEMFVDLVRKFKLSYKDLPFQLYQFSNKFRDELRARGGLLRVREFIMKDGYSFHPDEKDFEKTYEQMKKVYHRVFERLGLSTVIVAADNGYIGGEYCHEFIVESEIGESKFFTTPDGSYAAHEDVAKIHKESKNIEDPLKELEEVEAIRGTTMIDGEKLHHLPLWQQIKDVLYVDNQSRFILAIIRGDYDVNELKLQHLVKATNLRPATDEEIRTMIHSEPGFISPVRIKEQINPKTQFIIVADDSLRTVHNSYGGANKKHRDLLNINIDRDYTPDVEGDIAMAHGTALAPETKEPLKEKRGIEVGNIFQLGYHYSKLMSGAVFTDADGKEKPYYMGCYGIGIGRTMAAIVEAHHDDKGLLWPEAVAPFQIHLISLAGKAGEEVIKQADTVYDHLTQAGYEVLYDDRADKSAGEKFADSDLIGIPYRVIVSPKTIEQNKIELKSRGAAESQLVAIEELTNTIKIHR